MPLVKIHIPAGKTDAYKESVADGVHEALVQTAAVPKDDRFQILIEHPSGHIISDDAYAGAHRGPDRIIIEIVLNAGRTTEVKKKLYAAIAANLAAAPGIKGDDVMVSLQEVARENWSFAHGIAQYA